MDLGCAGPHLVNRPPGVSNIGTDMSRVITTRNNSLYTLKVIGEDGDVQLRLSFDGPMPDHLKSLMARGNAGDLDAAQEYVTEFIKYWHNQQPSDWAESTGYRH